MSENNKSIITISFPRKFILREFKKKDTDVEYLIIRMPKNTGYSGFEWIYAKDKVKTSNYDDQECYVSVPDSFLFRLQRTEKNIAENKWVVVEEIELTATEMKNLNKI